jgi:hypothetical protein
MFTCDVLIIRTINTIAKNIVNKMLAISTK